MHEVTLVSGSQLPTHTRASKKYVPAKDWYFLEAKGLSRRVAQILTNASEMASSIGTRRNLVSSKSWTGRAEILDISIHLLVWDEEDHCNGENLSFVVTFGNGRLSTRENPAHPITYRAS